MEQCHSGNEIMLESCWLHSMAKDQGYDIAWFFLPTCYPMSSSSTLPNRNSIVDPLHHGCEEQMIIIYIVYLYSTLSHSTLCHEIYVREGIKFHPQIFITYFGIPVVTQCWAP